MLNKYKIVGDTLIVYNRKDNKEMFFDAEDFDFVKNHTWRIDDGYAKTSKNNNGKITNTYAHRMLMNPSADKEVDHEDNNRANNRKSNLIVKTPAQNRHNNPTQNGYNWHKRSRKWRAQIYLQKKYIYLGLYNTEQEARAAYLEAKRKHHPSAPHHLYF